MSREAVAAAVAAVDSGHDTIVLLNGKGRYMDRITVDPLVCHGQPCFRGTRIMIYLVLDLLESGLSAPEIVDKYYPQLRIEAIRAAIGYAASMIRTEEYVPFSPAGTH